MNKLKALFSSRTIGIIGMIHVGALPGSPKFEGSVGKLVDRACKEAEIYKNCQIDGIMVENMHDIPYIQSKYFGPEVTASMTQICWEIKKNLPKDLPCGIQILAGGNKEALAVAKICDYQFIRAEGFVFSHIGDEGFMDATAGHLLRYRKYLNAENVLILTDIKKKHCSHAITSDLNITDVAKAAEFFLSDGLILTGTSTGDPANTTELESYVSINPCFNFCLPKFNLSQFLSPVQIDLVIENSRSTHPIVADVKGVTDLPVLVGSGITAENLHLYMQADAVIVGSYFKKSGRWENDLSSDNVLKFMEKVTKLREK